MSIKPESALKNKIHKHLNPLIHRQGMGGGIMCTNGTPDVYYESTKGSLFVEYKWIPKLQDTFTLIDTKKKPCLSKLQQIWLHRAVSNNASCGVALGSPKGIIWFPMDTWNLDRIILQDQFVWSVAAYCRMLHIKLILK